MHRNSRFSRVISLLLLLAMLVGLIPSAVFTVGAEEATGIADELPTQGDSLRGEILALLEPAAIARWYDHTVHRQSTTNGNMNKSITGAFFIVSVLSKNGRQRAFVLDPTMPSLYGSFAATEVTMSNTNSSGLPASGTLLHGVKEGMKIDFSSPSKNKWHNLKLNGPYGTTSDVYRLHNKVYAHGGSDVSMALYPAVATYTTGSSITNKADTFALDDRTVGNSKRVSFTYQGPAVGKTADYFHYLALSSKDPDAANLRFCLVSNTSAPANTSAANGYVSYPNYFANNLEQVSAYMFELIANRVDTSELYTALQGASEVLPWNSFYSRSIYDRLCAMIPEAMELYNNYNGTDVSSADSVQAKEAIYTMSRDLLNLTYALKVNKQNTHQSETFKGNTISYFDADMYVWNEAELNKLTRNADTKSGEKYLKGFYFGAVPEEGTMNQSYPTHSKFQNGTSKSQVLQIGNTKFTQTVGSYSIYSGLATRTLSKSGSPLADNPNIIDPGLWEGENWTAANGTPLRTVYSNVSVPFMYDRDTGYYTLSSDTNAVYFQGEPESGATLQIADKPVVINTGSGNKMELAEDPDTWVGGKFTTYGPYDSYSTSFQPFATVTDKLWKGASAYSPLTEGKKSLLDGYLLDGIPGTGDSYYTEVGKAAYGTGMAMEIEFSLTNDGRVNGKPITFNFSGDDDVWVYIDNQLVLDIGGLHGAIQGSIDFSTGIVSVYSERFNRIVDQSGKYGTDTTLYTYNESVSQTLGGITFGADLGNYKIVTGMKDNSSQVRLYQENLYTGQISDQPASATQIASYASSKETHTMKIFYMDRAQARTNCYISFNLPRPDTLVVEKDIEDFYGQIVDGEQTLGDEALTEEFINSLLEESYSFVLKNNGVPVSGIPYTVMEDKVRVGKGITKENGIFTIKGKQTAHFTGFDFLDGNTYAVEERLTGTDWGSPTYAYTYADSLGAVQSGEGNSFTPTQRNEYTSEVLTIRCSNISVRHGNLIPEGQRVVLDYGKPIDIEVVRNAVITGASELVVREGILTEVSLSEEDAVYGSAEILKGKRIVRFTPDRMLDRIVTLECTVMLSFEDGAVRHVGIPVYLIPATNVYYETDYYNEDFVRNVFSFYSKGYKNESENWKITGIPQNENQDMGNVGDQLYDFTIHKESLPYNSFFVDFDGDNERYFTQATYGKQDFDTKEYWLPKKELETTVNIDQGLGIMDVNFQYKADSNSYFYVQTRSKNSNAFDPAKPLMLHTGDKHYLQIRFKAEDFYQTGNTSLTVYFANNTVSDVVTDPNTYVKMPFDATYLENETFVTLTADLEDSHFYTKSTMINSIRIQLNGAAIAVGGNASLVMDYIYIGPLTDEGSYKGLGFEEKASQELFFDFDNSEAAKVRYQQPQYNYQLKGISAYRNFDTIASSSTSADATEGTWWASVSRTASVKTDTAAGILSFATTTNTSSAGTYGPYISTTATHMKFCWGGADYKANHSLNFTPTGETWFFARFKITDSVIDNAYKSDNSAGGEPYVQFSVVGEDLKGYYAYAPYTFVTGEYITVALNVTNKVNECLAHGPIRSMYLRFTHVKGKNTTTDGRIDVDYIYVGPKKNVFVDFTGSYNDEYRYASYVYDGTNMDALSHWNTAYFTNELQDGVLVATPTATFHNNADGYGQFFPEGTYLNYPLNGVDDIIRVRARFTGISAKNGTPYIRAYFGPKRSWWSGNTATAGPIPIQYGFDAESIDGQWIDFDFNIAPYKEDFDTIGSFALAVGFLAFAQGGTLEIDYIYIGSKAEFEETTGIGKAVYMEFDDSATARVRYNDELYSGINYDRTANWISINQGESYFTAEVNNGALKLIPGAGQKNHETGYGSIYPQPYDQSTLNYRLSGNDHIQMRLKFVGAQLHPRSKVGYPRAKVCLGEELIPYTEDGPRGDGNAERIEWKLELDDVVSEKWITVTLDLADYTWKYGRPDTIRFLIPIVQDVVFSTGGYVLIDYIYLGPAVEGRPVSDSLFFGFDNMQMDRERYSSTAYHEYSYSHSTHEYNYDVDHWATHQIASDSTSDYSISSNDGVLRLPVRNNPIGSNSYGPYLCTTVTNGSYGVDQSHRSLSYISEKAQYFQVRIRAVNCVGAIDGEQPRMLFLPAGFDSDKEYQDYNDLSPIASAFFEITDEYQTLTISVQQNIRELLTLTNMALRFVDIMSEGEGYIEIDYIYLGPGELAPDPVYGYDSSYTDDTTYSNGSSWIVEGQGVKLPNGGDDQLYTEASFDFRGTGFDLISRTGKEQATIRVEVKSKTTEELVKTLTVNNKGDMELDQIPVVSVQGLEHGEYTVTIWVNKRLDSSFEFLSRGGTFFFDAVRIYDPIETQIESTEAVLAGKAYTSDKEHWVYVKEVRDTLLSAADFGSGNFSNATDNALFVDMIASDSSNTTPAGNVSVTDHIAATVSSYNKVGPKNEIYLSPGEAVAFRLELDTAQKPVSIDIGAKTIVGGDAVLAAGFVSVPSTSEETLAVLSRLEEKLSSATAMYYDLDVTTLPASGDVYMVLYNGATGEKTENILSVTDLKVAYPSAPSAPLPEDNGGPEIHDESAKRTGTVLTEPYGFAVDARTLEAAAVFVRGILEMPLLKDSGRMYHSLDLASDISVNYVVSKADLEGKDKLRLEVRVPVYEGTEETGHQVISLSPVEKGSYVYFTLDGLTAVQMNDVLEAVLYWTEDGRSYYSSTDTYSVAQYAYAQLDSANAGEALKTLCANLLVYGSKAQSFKGYRVNALADQAMTAEHRSYCSDMEAVTFGNNNSYTTELSDPVITWKGKTLDLGTKVVLRYVVNAAQYQGDVEELSLHIHYVDLTGGENNVVLTEKKAYGLEDGLYVFDFDRLDAAELRSVLTATVYAGEQQLSNSLIYSMDTYGNGKTGALAEVCKALFAYSDSAKRYFVA